MPDYDLGTARGKIDIDGSGAELGFGRAEAAQTKFSRASRIAGGVIAGAGAAIAVGIGGAVIAAANFEERMSAVAAVSGASGKELDKLREKALQLGADTKFSATEAASAIEELVKAGVPVEDILNGAADAAVNLAAAGEVELAEAATIAANALNVFNLEGKDMEHVADLIAGAANASAIDVSEFGMSLQQAGATAALVGLDFDDLTLAIAAMGNAGIKGSDAGTSLKTFLANLQPTTKKQIDLFKELGLLTEETGNAFFDASGKIKPMREIAETLQTALAGMTDQQKALTLETLFGSDAIRAAAIIAGEGAEGFDELAASVGKTSAADVAAERMDNLKGSLEQLKGSLETLLIKFGTPLLKGIRGVVDAITGLANKFSGLNPNIQKAIVIIAAITAAVLLVGGTILLLVGWLGTLAAALGVTIGVLAGTIAIALAVAVAVAALIAAIVLLWRENETFRNIVMGVWNWIKKAVVTIIEAVKKAIASLADALGAAVDFMVPKLQWLAREFLERWRSMMDWLEANVWPVLTELKALIEGVVTFWIGVITRMEPIWKAVWGTIVTVVTTAIHTVKTIIETVVAVIQIIWNNFGMTLWNIIVNAWNTIRGVIEAALQIIKGIIQVVTGLITLDWTKVWEGIKNIVGGVWNAIVTIVTGLINQLKNIIAITIGVIKTIWQAGWEIIKGVVSIIWNTIKGIVTSAINFVKAYIQTALNFIKTIWNSAWNAIGSFLKAAWEAIKNAVITALNSVVSWLRDLPGRAIGALAGIATTLYSRGRELITGFLNGIINKAWELISWIASLPGKILSWIGDLGSLLYNAGKAVVQGFIDGIGSMIGSVKDKLGSITSSLTSWKGPPRKDRVILRENGQFVIQGFIQGIQDQIGPLRHLMEGIAPDLAGRMQGQIAGGRNPGPSTTNFNQIAPVIQLNFPNVTSSREAESIKEALGDAEVLGRLIHATRAGVGGR